MQTCCEHFRATGTTPTEPHPACPPGVWRVFRPNVKVTDLLIDSNLDQLLDTVQPRTIIDCVAYGAYSFETDSQLIYQTNFNLVSRLLARLQNRRIAAYLHAGSSSEYGYNASGPGEDIAPAPNSHYAVSKVAASNLIFFTARNLGCLVSTCACILFTGHSRTPHG